MVRVTVNLTVAVIVRGAVNLSCTVVVIVIGAGYLNWLESQLILFVMDRGL